MKNKDLIIKTARRLDKFSLDELIVVLELDEKEVTEILSDLVKPGNQNVSKIVELFNETSDYPRIAPLTFTKIRRNFEKYGFQGILPKYSKHI